jgi:hypothetical protein
MSTNPTFSQTLDNIGLNDLVYAGALTTVSIPFSMHRGLIIFGIYYMKFFFLIHQAVSLTYLFTYP